MERLAANPFGLPPQTARLYEQAGWLALITIFYNFLEGIVSTGFGISDETFVLFGFGLDSFVEVISGIGIWHMVRRLRQTDGETSDSFEKTALRVTGGAFYLLAVGLILTAIWNLLHGHAPETTFWGIVIALISIATMGFLLRAKVVVGRKLSSRAILADANCTKTCIGLSVLLLVASAGYAWTGLSWIDAAGSLGISVYAIREGREAFQKAAGGSCDCSDAVCP